MRGNVTITPSIYTCYGFKCNGQPQPTIAEVRTTLESQRRSVVIAPIRVFESPEEPPATLIAWGCSLGRKCTSPECRYAGKEKEESPVRRIDNR